MSNLFHRDKLSRNFMLQRRLLSVFLVALALVTSTLSRVMAQEKLTDQEIYDRIAKVLPDLEKSNSLDNREKGYLKAYAYVNQAERPDVIQLLRIANGVVEVYGERQNIEGIENAVRNLADKIDVSNVDDVTSSRLLDLFIPTALLTDRLQALHRYDLVEPYLTKLNEHLDKRFFEDLPFEQTSTPATFLGMQGLNELYSQKPEESLATFEIAQASLEKYYRYAIANSPEWKEITAQWQDQLDGLKDKLEKAKEKLSPEEIQAILEKYEEDDVLVEVADYEEHMLQSAILCQFGFLTLMARCERDKVEPDFDEVADLAEVVIGENLPMFFQAYNTMENIASDRGDLGVLQSLADVFEAVPLIKDSRGLRIKKLSAQTAEALPELSVGDRIVALNSWRQFDSNVLNNFAWAKRAVGSHEKFTLQVRSKKDGQIREYQIDPFQLNLTLEPYGF
ncbi:MAG: hypothetical protein Q4G03_07030 [Planctomycetia bacterium]|nr:hypothetical protein [Planctomycetia bacterium]